MSATMQQAPVEPRHQTQWAKVIDHTACIGCHACTTACKSENEVPLSVTRTYVKSVDVGRFPQARRAFQVTRCNQCADAPCVNACPTRAMYTRPDGIVDFAKSICIGCKACIAACPYDAIFINPDDHSAEKCNFCAHRIEVGLEPACVVVCPVEAILVGDLNDPASKVARIVQREPVSVRRPEKGTLPKLFYKGAHQATLDPIAARRPDGGLFMWSEQQGKGAQDVVSGYAGGANAAAEALLSYDVHHEAPWGWRVSLYTWTKSIAAGAYLVPLMLVLTNWLSWRSQMWIAAAPILAGFFLALTGLLLIWDLKHPMRFYLIFTRAQWKSWLVRGAFIIAGYSVVLVLSGAAGLLGFEHVVWWLTVPGAPLAVLTAAYTAYLFAQARARDLWQSALLPAHLVLQAFIGGSAIFLPMAGAIETALVEPLLWTLAVSSALHVLVVGAEAGLEHPTAHARLAAWEMTSGRFRWFFRIGMVAAVAAAFGPAIGTIAGPFALIGLAAYEHAYVQAGQAVPLA